jgi:hypothetical protein
MRPTVLEITSSHPKMATRPGSASLRGLCASAVNPNFQPRHGQID